jgi:predicted RNA-binding Zn ribbon-like protein
MDKPSSFIPFHPSQIEVCLDFANTVRWHASDRPEEKLHTYPDLVTWAREQGLVKANEARALVEMAHQHPREAAESLQRVLSLREAIYRVFTAQAHGQHPARTDLDQINAAASEYLAKSQVFATPDGFQWGWMADEPTLNQMLGPIALAAANLLTSKELLPRVGQCADDRGCGWLFLDRSKNRSRQWCDINDCGNRAKQKRHYERTQRKNRRKRIGRV